MPLARRVLVAPAAMIMLFGACSASVEQGHGTTAPTSGRSPADFVDCTSEIPVAKLKLPKGRAQLLRFGCGPISVPLDYAHPTGKKITLGILKIHDTEDTHPIGSLLVNPGGPGASAVNLALGLAGQLSDTILEHFDIVGFDPRGVGNSTPVTCLSDAQKDKFAAASPDMLTAAGFAQAKALAKQFADSCASKYGSSLGDFDTVQSAMDMDQVRQAVGDDRLNYLGFSYGTELGAQYLHLFPGRMRVAVLDGAVDPLTDPITTDTNQLRGFEGAFDQFAAWCRTHAPCRGIGDPRAAVTALVNHAQQSPIPTSTPGDRRRATSDLVLTGVSQAMYSQPEWATLGRALVAAQGGDAKGLLALADEYNQRLANGHYTNIADAYNTIQCNDQAPGPSDATIRATARAWITRFPLFGPSFAPGLFNCQQWTAKRSVPPKPTAPTTPNKVLVIGNLHDPATPYQGAKDLAATLGNAELLTWDGEGHTSYLEGSSCVDGYVNHYLVNLTLPPTGKTCPR